jgi:hypothetical protein
MLETQLGLLGTEADTFQILARSNCQPTNQPTYRGIQRI